MVAFNAGDAVGLIFLIVVAIFAPMLFRYGPRRTANTVKAVKNEVTYRAEDRRRRAEGSPSQQQQSDELFNRFVASRGAQPASDSAKQMMGWDEATHGVAAREAAIDRLQRELRELRDHSGGSVELS